MNKILPASQTDLLKQAEEELSNANQLMEQFAQEWGSFADQSLDNVENIRTLQLLLQYRLDTQNTLNQLGKLQQYLKQLLGIENQHSFDTQLERLSFALGEDDLQIILSMLNQLIDSLMDILAHTLQQQKLDRKQAKDRLIRLKRMDLLLNASNKQKNFIHHINHLQSSLRNTKGAPIYDHIAALVGPISRFQQAIQHGLILSAGLYQQLQTKPKLDFPPIEEQLSTTLQPMNDTQKLFITTKENTHKMQLEERASEKRLGQFFNFTPYPK